MAVSVGEHTGTVKWFSSEKGYGFVSRDGGDKDIFLHAGECRRSNLDSTAVQEGDELRFDVIEGPRGLKATNISRI